MSTLHILSSAFALGGTDLLLAQAPGFDILLGYIGPGAGLSMIGSLLAVVCVILLALLGLFLYPLRLALSFLRRRREQVITREAETSAQADERDAARVAVARE